MSSQKTRDVARCDEAKRKKMKMSRGQAASRRDGDGRSFMGTVTDRRMTLLHLVAGTEGPITRPIRSSRLGRNLSVPYSV